ncbi:MAG: polymer-forming cytoskeletal protein [Clostridia bacterium]|nr:polymer-forming cytoskeletal protein [Clostridia bacterium]
MLEELIYVIAIIRIYVKFYFTIQVVTQGGETGVVLGEICANNIILSGTVEGNVHCTNSLKLTSSAKLTGDAYVKNFSSDEGCLFGGKCIMEEMEKLKQKSNEIDKNFDMSTPKKTKKATIISELEDTEQTVHTAN